MRKTYEEVCQQNIERLIEWQTGGANRLDLTASQIWAALQTDIRKLPELIVPAHSS